MELANVLRGALNPSTVKRTEEQLDQMKQENYAYLFYLLSQELANEENDVDVREVAGLYLKKELSGKTARRKKEIEEMWMGIEDSQRAEIKGLIIPTLGSQQYEARHTAAVLVGCIAAVEFPNNSWLEIIDQIVSVLSVENVSNESRHATLEAMGFITEMVPPQFLESKSLEILKAIVDGLREDEKEDKIKLAAVNALNNSLEFLSQHFEIEEQRKFVMYSLLSGVECSDVKVRKVAYETLGNIALHYYEHLPESISRIFQMSVNAIMNDAEEVALQAMEFWTTVAEVEIEIERIRGESNIKDDLQENHKFLENAFPFFCSTIFANLQKQTPNQDETERWNISLSAGLCLRNIAECIHNNVVESCIEFVKANIGLESWRQMEASAIVLGCIMEGPDPENLAESVFVYLPAILYMLQPHNEELVRHSATWALSRICEFLSPWMSEEAVNSLFEPLFLKLRDEPKIASQAACSLANLAHGFAKKVEMIEQGAHLQKFNPFDVGTPVIVQRLLECSSREDADEHRLAETCFGSANTLVECTSESSKEWLTDLLPVILHELNESLMKSKALVEGGGVAIDEDAEELSHKQVMLSSVVHACVYRMGEVGARWHEEIVHLLVVASEFAKSNTLLLQEILLIISAISSNSEGNQLNTMMPVISAFILLGLEQVDEAPIVSKAVGALSDVSCTLGRLMNPYSGAFMDALINVLSEITERAVKPAILTALGDMARSLEDGFEKFFNPVAQILQQAMLTPLVDESGDDEYNPDFYIFINDLHMAVNDVCTHIVQGLHSSGKGDVFASLVGDYLIFFKRIWIEGYNDLSWGNKILALNTLGDILRFCPSSMLAVEKSSLDILGLVRQVQSEVMNNIAIEADVKGQVNEAYDWIMGVRHEAFSVI